MIRAVAAALLLLATTGASGPAQRGWVGAWGFAPTAVQNVDLAPLPPGTFRYRIRLTQEGARLRLTLGNPDAALPLAVFNVRVAAPMDATGFSAGQPLNSVTFKGERGATLAGGASLTSDAVALQVRAGGDLIVTLTTSTPATDVPANTGISGDFAADGAAVAPSKRRPFVTRIDVDNAAVRCTIVALGDSITEGTGGTDAAWRGWPGLLARRLIDASPARHCGVVNMGIGGNRVLREGRGTAAIDRFARDVAGVPGATHVIVLEGINDLTRSAQPGEPPVIAADLIAGYRQLIAAAHGRGLRVIGGTIPPAGGSRAGTPALDVIRQGTNRWIRESKAFDAVIDFDAVTRDPGKPSAMLPAYDSGDHLHPSDAGYAAMADAIPLALFSPRRIGR